LKKYTLITFNGNKYDRLVCEAACRGFSNTNLHKVSQHIITENAQPWEVRRQFGLIEMKIDHIDLIELCPLDASLKIYAGRMHCDNLQDLPLDPNEPMTQSMIEPMRTYCGYDNDNTALILKQVQRVIALRELMSKEYNVDLRSKSDAQIAETVIKNAVGRKIDRPKIKRGTAFKYVGPAYLNQFKTQQLKDLVSTYQSSPIVVGKTGHCELIFNYKEVELRSAEINERLMQSRWTEDGTEPEIKELKKLKAFKPQKQIKLKIGNTNYAVGIGGIHSKEKHTSFQSCDKYQIREYDVAAFYPNIILNNDLYPKHIGEKFTRIFRDIVNRRLAAKKAKNKIDDASLKVTINGTFGTLGSKWSVLYAPDLMANVTITGQLSLLLLIERFELAGISVISANTDGIVVKIPRDREADAAQIIEDWEFDTNYDMEGNDYDSLNCRDVNAYIAIKSGYDKAKEPLPGQYSDDDLGIKGKGLYAPQYTDFYCLRSNPACDISTEAVKLYLKFGTPIEETVRNCHDVRRFLTLRKVNGGAVQNGVFLGKAIRWYYGSYELEPIRYVKTGNKVPKSEGAVPLMKLDGDFPIDMDYERYIDEAYTILADIGRKVA